MLFDQVRSIDFVRTDANVIGDLKTGENGDICDGGKIYCDMELGENVHISVNFTGIGKGKINIGTNSTIAPNVTVYTSYPNHRTGATNKYVTNHQGKVGDVYIGDNVFIGTGCVIGAGVEIEDGSIVEPLTHIKPFTVWKNTKKWRK